NVGTKPATGDTKANLHLLPNSADHKYWSLRPVSGTSDTSEIQIIEPATYNDAVGLEPTRRADFQVKITPTSLGQRSWELTVYSNDADEAETKVLISADIVNLPPCRYTVTPSTINFGVVAPPDYKDLSFSIRNESLNPGEICLLSGLDVAPGT